MEKYFKEQTSVVSYDNDIFRTNFDNLALERSKTKSMYSELLSVVKNLSIGMDLTRIQAPIFILRPISFLELFSQYAQPTEEILKVSLETDPTKRMLIIAKFFISSFFSTVKSTLHMGKPYNPILGEQFRCEWKHEDSTSQYYSEQVSHHPPITAAYLINKEKNLEATCTIENKLNFLGNSAENIVLGKFSLNILNLNGMKNIIDILETYVIDFPKIVVKGIFYGRGGIDNGGDLKITCPQTNMTTDLSFGSNHQVSGSIKKIDGPFLYRITGSMKDKVLVSNDKSKHEVVAKKQLECIMKDVKDQHFMESRRLWYPVTDAIIKGDSDLALKLKSDLEEQQRNFRKNESFEPHLFSITDEVEQGVPVYKFK